VVFIYCHEKIISDYLFEKYFYACQIEYFYATPTAVENPVGGCSRDLKTFIKPPTELIATVGVLSP
jgi:hypothetical protein